MNLQQKKYIDKVERVVKMLDARLTTRQIAERIGVRPRDVAAIANDAGYERDPASDWREPLWRKKES